jgi:hypothetical protein
MLFYSGKNYIISFISLKEFQCFCIDVRVTDIASALTARFSGESVALAAIIYEMN